MDVVKTLSTMDLEVAMIRIAAIFQEVTGGLELKPLAIWAFRHVLWGPKLHTPYPHPTPPLKRKCHWSSYLKYFPGNALWE